MAIKSHKISKRLKANTNFRVFLVFLSLAVSLWLLINLSKTYTSKVQFNAVYSNLPKDKVFQAAPKSTVDATIVASGFSLLRYKIRKRDLIFNVSNVSFKQDNKYYFLPNNYLFDLKNQLLPETEINRIEPDSIFMDLGLNISKKIPVIIDSDIEFKLGYHLVDDIIVSPDSITIIGPESHLDKIVSIRTKQLKLTDVSENIQTTVKLEFLNTDESISISSDEVIVTAEIDKFTEGSIMLPFKVLNIPDDKRITTFPSQVEVVYQVGLSNFSKITEDSFNVICDFEHSLKNNLNYLIPKIAKVPPMVTSVKIVPEKIDFIIQE